MQQGTSTFLDWSRIVAAVAVLCVHTMLLVPGAEIKLATPLGSEAVSVFFVLSGFVIAHVTATSERDARTYAINRLARIYSVAVPAILVTLAIDAYGRAFLPNTDPLYWGHTGFGQIARCIGALLFVNEAVGRHIVPGSNHPWWSLGMEVPYYAAFAIAFFAPSQWKWLAAVFIALFPRAAILAPMWVLGFALYHAPAPRPRSAAPIMLFAALAYAIFEILRCRFGWGEGGEPLYLVNWRSWPFFLVAIIFGIAAYGSRGLAHFPGRAASRWLSGRMFTLYLMHFPSVQLIASALPDSLSPFTKALFCIGLAFVSVLALAEVGETRKRAWRRFFVTAFAERAPTSWLKDAR